MSVPVALTDLWTKALAIVRAEVSEQCFTVWFQPLRALDLAGDTLKIGAPNTFCRDWLLENYSSLLDRALREAAGRPLGFEIAIFSRTEEPAPLSRRMEGPAKKVSLPSYPGAVNLNAKYTFANFVVGPSNRFAHAAALAVAESPARSYNPLFIYGPVGLGKTHLMQAIGLSLFEKRSDTKLLYISSERFVNELIDSIQNRTTLRFRQKYRNLDILLIDDIHFIAGKESTQEEFFHTFNTLYDANKQIVVSSDRSPKNIPGLEERLVSRFEWGLVTDVQAPDLETRVAILRKKAEREVLAVPDDVCFFIAEQITANIRELEGALIRVVAYASLTGEKVGVGLVKEVLKDCLPTMEKKITLEYIQKKVADFFGIGLLDMKSKKRTQSVAFPRQVAMYLVRKLTHLSLLEIGDGFGGKDHSTILHACQKIERQQETDEELRRVLDGLLKDIQAVDK